jgi:mRNA-degrading endonuclease RelE of RelBE toxin-antitoxin system
MNWQIRYAQSVQKSLRKLTPEVRQRIRNYLETCLLQHADPSELGKALKGRTCGAITWVISASSANCAMMN